MSDIVKLNQNNEIIEGAFESGFEYVDATAFEDEHVIMIKGQHSIDRLLNELAQAANIIEGNGFSGEAILKAADMIRDLRNEVTQLIVPDVSKTNFYNDYSRGHYYGRLEVANELKRMLGF